MILSLQATQNPKDQVWFHSYSLTSTCLVSKMNQQSNAVVSSIAKMVCKCISSHNRHLHIGAQTDISLVMSYLMSASGSYILFMVLWVSLSATLIGGTWAYLGYNVGFSTIYWWLVYYWLTLKTWFSGCAWSISSAWIWLFCYVYLIFLLLHILMR